MNTKELLVEYIKGMKAQQADIKKQADMLEGAIGFAEQFLGDLEKGDKGGDNTPPEYHENKNAEILPGNEPANAD